MFGDPFVQRVIPGLTINACAEKGRQPLVMAEILP